MSNIIDLVSTSKRAIVIIKIRMSITTLQTNKHPVLKIFAKFCASKIIAYMVKFVYATLNLLKINETQS